jgi:hypothetical protein
MLFGVANTITSSQHRSRLVLSHLPLVLAAETTTKKEKKKTKK